MLCEIAELCEQSILFTDVFIDLSFWISAENEIRTVWSRIETAENKNDVAVKMKLL